MSEADVGRLEPGMPATFVVDAYPERKFKGVIRQIRDAPQTLQNVVTYDAVVDVDNADLRLKPGMTANVTFVYAERKDVLRIPSAALRFRPPEELLAAGVGKGSGGGGKKKKNKGASASASPRQRPRRPSATKTVWAMDGEKLREVPVEIGVSDGNKVEVKKGALGEGDVLITDAIAKNEPAARARTRAAVLSAARRRVARWSAARRSSRSPTSPRPIAWARWRSKRCAA